MAKIVKFDTEARNKMLKGVDTLANTVKVNTPNLILFLLANFLVSLKTFWWPLCTPSKLPIAKAEAL